MSNERFLNVLLMQYSFISIYSIFIYPFFFFFKVVACVYLLVYLFIYDQSSKVCFIIFIRQMRVNLMLAVGHRALAVSSPWLPVLLLPAARGRCGADDAAESPLSVTCESSVRMLMPQSALLPSVCCVFAHRCP